MMDILILLFVLLAILVGIVSSVTLVILFKHAEKRTIANKVTLVYLAFFFFILLGAFVTSGVL